MLNARAASVPVILVIAEKINGLTERGVTDEADCYRAVMAELVQESRKENERLLQVALKLVEKVHALRKQIEVKLPS